MIRFVDVRGQVFLDDSQPIFSFYDTVRDRYVEDDNSDQVWENKTEFVEGMQPRYEDEFIQRCIGLMPNWVPESSTSTESAEP